MSQTAQTGVHWSSNPRGRAVRAVVAGIGMAASFSVLLRAGTSDSGVWVFVLGGVALAATSVRAAWLPSWGRLVTLLANVAAIPLLLVAI